MAKVDFKVTAWERVEIKDECLAEVIEKIKSGEIQTSNDLIETNYVTSDDGNYMVIPEVTISLDDNDDYATIEVIVDGETIYHNGE